MDGAQAAQRGAQESAAGSAALKRFRAPAAAGAVFLLSLLSLIEARWVPQWQLTILTTEYGHWLAPAVLLLLGLQMKWGCGLRGAEPRIRAALLAASAALFLRPAALAFLGADAWREQLAVFGEAPTGSVVRPWRLWRLVRTGWSAERHIYDVKNGLYLDLYRPGTEGPSPWVLAVHGGGWNNGTPAQFVEMNARLAERGYAVAAISYRLAPEWKWPAPREDVLNAAAFLRSRAAKLGLDPGRWAVLGRSAGGHIAEAVAYQSRDPSLKGCVAFYAPADLNFAYEYAEEDDIIDSRDLLRGLLDGNPADRQAAYDDASPILAVGPASPPTLLLHGRRDPLTWVVQSRRLKARLETHGVKSAFLELPWATHAFDFNPDGPGGQLAEYAVLHFLKHIFEEGS